ncbi:hypothetical protein RHECNPAF_431003 [Rhizobium etli CNPAF512]|nr:hypothetical protein RHECNPAF_431003 [Rhizobium etli CNPAF512]
MISVPILNAFLTPASAMKGSCVSVIVFLLGDECHVVGAARVLRGPCGAPQDEAERPIAQPHGTPIGPHPEVRRPTAGASKDGGG